MHLAVGAEGKPVDVLPNDCPGEIAFQREAVDVERRRNPLTDAVEERLGHQAHLGAIVREAIGREGVKVLRPESHDGIEILGEKGATVLVVALFQLPSNEGRVPGGLLRQPGDGPRSDEHRRDRREKER